MNISEEKKELFKAISAAQGEFTNVFKGTANPFFKSKYASLDAIAEMIRPILPKHGLSVMQFTDIPESGTGIIVETLIAHESGQHISSKLFMPVAKSDPQGYGSALTYGRRYALAACLGIVSDEDSDGNDHMKKENVKIDAPILDAAIVANLNAATTLKELATVWSSLDVGLRSGYAAVKDERKKQLSEVK